MLPRFLFLLVKDLMLLQLLAFLKRLVAEFPAVRFVWLVFCLVKTWCLNGMLEVE